MRVVGHKNLRTMDEASSRVIEGTNNIYIFTKTGKWSVDEQEDGSLRLRAVDTEMIGFKGLLTIVPESANSIKIEMR